MCTFLMTFCSNMYSDNRKKPIESEGHRSKVRVMWFVFVFFWSSVHGTATSVDST